jgi:squalene cyclase
MTDWRSRQNRDGGWAYSKGGSWIEPTAFVLLAQTATQVERSSFEAGVKFLRSTQRRDGGWSPQPDVAESTWVTALAALLPEEALGADRMKRALGWLEDQTGRDSSWSYRFAVWRTGDDSPHPDGWPWFPGASAWVTPTSLGILAFGHALRRRDNRALRRRVQSGREFLAQHVCADGGWNHGSNKALGRDGDSYPETTGVALTALAGVSKSAEAKSVVGGKLQNQLIERGITAARRHLSECRTAEGIAWLKMGLAAHGAQPGPTIAATPRTTLDAALAALASAEKNPLLVQVTNQ